jgi:hypothetical protein
MVVLGRGLRETEERLDWTQAATRRARVITQLPVGSRLWSSGIPATRLISLTATVNGKAGAGRGHDAGRKRVGKSWQRPRPLPDYISQSSAPPERFVVWTPSRDLQHGIGSQGPGTAPMDAGGEICRDWLASTWVPPTYGDVKHP